MLNLLKKLFGSKPVAAPADSAKCPFKIEEPAAPAPVAHAASEAVVKSIAPKAPAKKTALKKAAPKKQPAPAKKSKPKA